MIAHSWNMQSAICGHMCKHTSPSTTIGTWKGTWKTGYAKPVMHMHFMLCMWFVSPYGMAGSVLKTSPCSSPSAPAMMTASSQAFHCGWKGNMVHAITCKATYLTFDFLLDTSSKGLGKLHLAGGGRVCLGEGTGGGWLSFWALAWEVAGCFLSNLGGCFVGGLFRCHEQFWKLPSQP